MFDARETLRRPNLDRGKLRLEFVVYGGLNRVDWRTITAEHIHTTARDVDAQLIPMLRHDVRPAKAEVAKWTDALIQETRDLMASVLPLEHHEIEFIERLNDAGDIVPELLTPDPAMQAIVRDHPGLKWKALNVKKRRGAWADDDDEPA